MILWRYLVGQFLKTFLFATLAIVLCLLTLRMQEIAHFASIDTSRDYLIGFITYQIPYILPVAIPLSGLISSMILITTLSHHYEIVALRAQGYSLSSLFAPLLFSAFCLSIINFAITSEIATLTHRKTSLLKSELRSINPLLALHNKHLLQMKGIFFDALGTTKMGELASDALIAFPGKKGERIHLFLAKKLEAKDEAFIGENLTLITPLEEDKILVENIGHTHSKSHDFSDLLQKKVWSLNDDHLGFKSLLLRLNELNHQPEGAMKKLAKTRSRLLSEMTRRLSLGFAPFTFTLIGLSFGLSIGRTHTRRGLLWVTALAAFFLITFFLAKGIDDNREASLLLYTLPHAILIAAGLYNLRQINLGKES